MPTPDAAQREGTAVDSTLATTTKQGMPCSWDMSCMARMSYPPSGSGMTGVTFSGLKLNQKNKPALYWRKNSKLNVMTGQTSRCHAHSHPHRQAKLVLRHSTAVHRYHRHTTEHRFKGFSLVKCICPADFVSRQVVLCLPAIGNHHLKDPTACPG